MKSTCLPILAAATMLQPLAHADVTYQETTKITGGSLTSTLKLASAVILSLVVLQSGATAQMKSLCSLVTVEDAQAFFGAPAQQDMSTPQICGYSSKGQTVTLAIVNYTVAANAKMLFEMNRQGMVDAKGSPKDEPGLGATAFSASTKSTFEIFLLKGNATVQLTAVSANDRTAIAATELDKLREVAKKAAARM